jgi:hypothetical protein
MTEDLCCTCQSKTPPTVRRPSIVPKQRLARRVELGERLWRRRHRCASRGAVRLGEGRADPLVRAGPPGPALHTAKSTSCDPERPAGGRLLASWSTHNECRIPGLRLLWNGDHSAQTVGWSIWLANPATAGFQASARRLSADAGPRRPPRQQSAVATGRFPIGRRLPTCPTIFRRGFVPFGGPQAHEDSHDWLAPN